MAQYLKIGQSVKIGDDYYFKFAFSENGRCFKDEKAYMRDWDAPCYVPENSLCIMDPELPDFDVKNEYYTHNQLLEICFGNKDMCDALFGAVDWQFPTTWIDELEAEDIYDLYKFVRSGARIYWNDPDQGLSSGIYEVITGPFDVENPEDVAIDFESIVHITNGATYAEVPLSELVKPEWHESLVLHTA